MPAATRSISTPHGHHPTLTDVDGYALPAGARVTRDTFDVGPGQRIDLALQTGDDGYHASGPGVWMLHDHSPHASSNKGIGPGGNHTMIVYDSFMGKDGMPHGHAAHARYFRPEYYQGSEPVFDPKLFASTPERYESGWPRRAAGRRRVRLSAAPPERSRPYRGST